MISKSNNQNAVVAVSGGSGLRTGLPSTIDTLLMFPIVSVNSRRSMAMAGLAHWPPLLVAALLAIGSPAAAQSLAIPAYVIAGGGDTSGADGVYTLTGTIGQAAAGGELVGGTFSLVGGFWAFLRVGGFTDDPLIAGLSVIRAVHIAELRARIDAVRARFLLGAYPYTDSIMANATTIRPRQMTETRTALDEAYDAAKRTRPNYSTSPEVGVTIRVADIAELRAAIQAIE